MYTLNIRHQTSDSLRSFSTSDASDHQHAMSVTASRKSASPHKYFYSIFNVYFCLRETNAQRKAENRRDALAVRQRKNTVTNTTGSSTRLPGRLNWLDGRHVSVRRWACTVRCNPVCAVCVSFRHARTRHADIRRVCAWPNGLKLIQTLTDGQVQQLLSPDVQATQW